jgi:hypothetical protein
MVRSLVYGPRARRVYYVLGRILALVIVVVAAIIAFAALAHGNFAPAVIAFSVVLLAISFVMVAHRRTRALADRETGELRTRADAAFERWLREGRATFVARIRLRTYLICVVLALGCFALLAGGMAGRSTVTAAVLGAGLVFASLAITNFLRHHEALEIGPLGIDDRLGFGLIKWSDIRGASLYEHETKGVRVAEVSLDVSDGEGYGARRGLASRILGPSTRRGNTLRLPLQHLDQPGRTVFSVIRRQHEQLAPRGSVSGPDTFYTVDESWAKEHALNDRAIATMKSLSEETRHTQEDPRFKSDPVRQAALEAKVKASFAEIERLHGESMQLAKVRLDAMEARTEAARKQLRRMGMIVVVGIVAIIAMAVFRVIAR